MPNHTIYIAEPPAVSPGADGLVHIAAGSGQPPKIMTRAVALAIARGLLASVAVLEDREHAPKVVKLRGGGR